MSRAYSHSVRTTQRHRVFAKRLLPFSYQDTVDLHCRRVWQSGKPGKAISSVSVLSVRMVRTGLPVSMHRRQDNTLRLYTRSPSCCSSPSLAETQRQDYRLRPNHEAPFCVFPPLIPVPGSSSIVQLALRKDAVCDSVGVLPAGGILLCRGMLTT